MPNLITAGISVLLLRPRCEASLKNQQFFTGLRKIRINSDK